MKKILSIFMAMMLAVSAMAFGFSAQAAEADSLTVTVSGLQLNAITKNALDEVNKLRKANGLTELGADAQLTNVARKCAAQTMLHNDVDFNQPNGEPITALIPGFGATETVVIFSPSEDTASALVTILKSYLGLDTEKAINSVGLGTFKVGDTTVMYGILSTKVAASVTTDFKNSAYTAKEKILVDYLSYGMIDFNHIKNGSYNLILRVKGSGFSNNYFDAENSNIVYSSSNASIFKIKGAKGYVKKNGTVTVSAKTKAGSDLLSGKLPCTATKYKPSITSIGAKKKAFTVKWSKNIANANGYQIQYSTNKKFKNAKTVTVKGKNSVSKTIKKLKSKKTYYVRVRAYVNQGDGENLYTPWSAKKSVKVK